MLQHKSISSLLVIATLSFSTVGNAQPPAWVNHCTDVLNRLLRAPSKKTTGQGREVLPLGLKNLGYEHVVFDRSAGTAHLSEATTSIGVVAEILFTPFVTKTPQHISGVIVGEEHNTLRVLDDKGQVHLLCTMLGTFNEVWLKHGPTDVKWHLFDLKVLDLTPEFYAPANRILPNFMHSDPLYVIFKGRTADHRIHYVSGYLNWIPKANGGGVFAIISGDGGVHFFDSQLLPEGFVGIYAFAQTVFNSMAKDKVSYVVKSDERVSFLPNGSETDAEYLAHLNTEATSNLYLEHHPTPRL